MFTDMFTNMLTYFFTFFSIWLYVYKHVYMCAYMYAYNNTQGKWMLLRLSHAYVGILCMCFNLCLQAWSNKCLHEWLQECYICLQASKFEYIFSYKAMLICYCIINNVIKQNSCYYLHVLSLLLHKLWSLFVQRTNGVPIHHSFPCSMKGLFSCLSEILSYYTKH